MDRFMVTFAAPHPDKPFEKTLHLWAANEHMAAVGAYIYATEAEIVECQILRVVRNETHEYLSETVLPISG